MKYIEAKGETIDAAVESALLQLGMTRDDVSVEVLQQPKSGFLGFGKEPAIVRVSYETTPTARAVDFLKGLLPTLAAMHVHGRFADLAVCVGLACVVGHTLTVFMRFRGGKGVATAFGMMIALAPYPTLAAFGVFVVTVWLSHYISLGSCSAAAYQVRAPLLFSKSTTI